MNVLIAYDGSTDADAGIAIAARMYAGAETVVVSVWEGFSDVVARSRSGQAVAALDFEGIDHAAEKRAEECAAAGAERARAGGLAAQPRIVHRRFSVWETILEAAADADADVIVLGSRGLSGVASVLLGSVSRGVLTHADRPVLVVPTIEVARERQQDLRSARVGAVGRPASPRG
jgi:nucleotide-binding universal stress UspA family protein